MASEQRTSEKARKRRGAGEGSIRRLPTGRWQGRITIGFGPSKTRAGEIRRDANGLPLMVQQRRTVYGKTRGVVARELARLMREQGLGLPVAADKQTVEQFLVHWRDRIVRPKVREATWKTYDSAIRACLIPGLGPLRLQALTPQRIQAWINSAVEHGMPARRCAYARAVLRTALNQALAWNLIARNPAAGKLLTLPRTTRNEIRPLNPDQARILLSAVEGHRWRALFTVALALGLRLGEACGLRWEDIDLPGRRLSVRQTVQRGGGDPVRRRALWEQQRAIRRRLAVLPPAAGSRDAILATLAGLLQERRALVRARNTGPADDADRVRAELARVAGERGRLWRAVRTAPHDAARDALRAELARVRGDARKVSTRITTEPPKTERSRRTIVLPEVVARALEVQRKRQLEARLAAGKTWQDSGFVFTTWIGTPLDGCNVRHAYKRILRAAGLPETVRFHDLRHTAATLLLAQGVDVRTIMAVLGHSQISLTMDTYAHVLPALQTDAAGRMDAILSGTEG